MEKIKDKIIEILTRSFECEAIVIFGSFARNTQNEESDVDIAVKTKNEIGKKELFEISRRLGEEIKRDVDLVNIDTIENDGFKYEILINGKVIYCEDDYKFDMYKLDAYREYLELNEARKDIIEKMKSGKEK